MRNIEIFRLIVFNVIKEIVTVFPDYASFTIEDILPESECKDEELRDRYCRNTIEWLKANSYIEVISEELPVTGWDMVVPTEKTLSLMSVELPSLHHKTLLSSIAEIGKAGLKDAAQEAVKDFIMAAVKLAPYAV